MAPGSKSSQGVRRSLLRILLVLFISGALLLAYFKSLPKIEEKSSKRAAGDHGQRAQKRHWIQNCSGPAAAHALPHVWSAIQGNFPPRSLSSLRNLRDALVGYSANYPVGLAQKVRICPHVTMPKHDFARIHGSGKAEVFIRALIQLEPEESMIHGEPHVDIYSRVWGISELAVFTSRPRKRKAHGRKWDVVFTSLCLEHRRMAVA
eukprot:672530-Pelagomonas_calceolata.AAC.1